MSIITVLTYIFLILGILLIGIGIWYFFSHDVKDVFLDVKSQENEPVKNNGLTIIKANANYEGNRVHINDIPVQKPVYIEEDDIDEYKETKGEISHDELNKPIVHQETSYLAEDNNQETEYLDQKLVGEDNEHETEFLNEEESIIDETEFLNNRKDNESDETAFLTEQVSEDIEESDETEYLEGNMSTNEQSSEDIFDDDKTEFLIEELTERLKSHLLDKD